MEGRFLVDSQGRSYWSATGNSEGPKAPAGGAPVAAPAGGQDGTHKVNAYTGVLDRKDFVPKKPVAAMSFGQRVRISRLYDGWEVFEGKVIKVCGWAKSTRAQSKDFCFVELNDGSCFRGLQCVIDKNVEGFPEVHKAIVGASFQFTGTIIKSPAKGQEFELCVKDPKLHKALVLGHCDGTYPIQGRPKMEVSKLDDVIQFLDPQRASSLEMQDQHFWCCDQSQKQPGLCYPHLLPVKRFPVHSHPNHHWF